jgi:cytochrome c oxidase subunit 1
MTLWLVSMAIFIASSLMGSLNYIVTVINLRTEGMSMTFNYLGFLCYGYHWCGFFSCIVICTAVIDFDRSWYLFFFLSDIYIAGEVLHYQGGSPVLFEHLFWF